MPQYFIDAYGWGIAAFALAALAIYQLYDILENYKADTRIRSELLAYYALGATAFVSLGLFVVLPWTYLPMAIAAQILATVWISQKLDLGDELSKIIYGLLIAFACLYHEQIWLFLDIFGNSIVGEEPSSHIVRMYVLDAPLVKLGIPALFLAGAASLEGLREQSKRLTFLLWGLVTVLFNMAVYYAVRDLFHVEGMFLNTLPAFTERGLITFVLATVGVCLILLSDYDRFKTARYWGYSTCNAMLARVVYFDLLIQNPLAQKGQLVGDMLLLNGLTLTYLSAAVLSLWLFIQKKQNVYKVLTGLFFFVYITLSVRQAFRGSDIYQGMMSNAEMYSYSVVWLVAGLALLAYGIYKDYYPARKASVVLIGLTVCKVFLLDAAGLDGLYRVVSFFGLGVSLIGLSYFYSKFVFAKGKQNAE